MITFVRGYHILCIASHTQMNSNCSVFFRPARYTVFVPDPDKHDAPSWEAGVTFLVSNFQYVIYGFVFAPGRPYRAPIQKNRELLGLLRLLASLTLSPRGHFGIKGRLGLDCILRRLPPAHKSLRCAGQ